MRTIVAPVNFSEHSNHAARYAADMARSIGANLHLVHFIQAPVMAAELPLTDFVYDTMQQAGAQAMEKLFKELAARTNSEVYILTTIETGNADRGIDEFSKKYTASFIVMGTPDSFMERGLGGSRTIAALRRLRVPMIVVPETAVFRPVRKLLLACELNDLAGALPVPAAVLSDLRDLFNASVEVLTVNTRKQVSALNAVFESGSWKARFGDLFPEPHFIDMDKVEDGVRRYLSENEVDLVVVFPKQHPFFEFHASQAKAILLNSTVPVMSIHS